MGKKTGRFIVIEGLDGSGKTIAAYGLASKLGNAVYTKEPTDGIIGSMIRKVLNKEISLDERTLALLFAADRSQHIEEFIIPNLEKGIDVVCDRYYYSNMAYQGCHYDKESIYFYNCGMLTPDHVFFIDTPIETCLERIYKRNEQDLYETKETLLKVKDNYDYALNKFVNFFVEKINGNKSRDEIVNEMIYHITKWDFLYDNKADI